MPKFSGLSSWNVPLEHSCRRSEHVTPWFAATAGLRWGHFRHHPVRPYFVTVDDPVDLEVVRRLLQL